MALQPAQSNAVERRQTLLRTVGFFAGAVALKSEEGSAADFGCTPGVDDYYCQGGKLRAQNGLPAWTPAEKKDTSETCGQLRCGYLSRRRAPSKPASAPRPAEEREEQVPSQ